jgi:hypothetical protein
MFRSMAMLLKQNAETPPKSRKDKMEAVTSCCFNMICKACDDIDSSQAAVLSDECKLLCQFSFHLGGVL